MAVDVLSPPPAQYFQNSIRQKFGILKSEWHETSYKICGRMPNVSFSMEIQNLVQALWWFTSLALALMDVHRPCSKQPSFVVLCAVWRVWSGATQFGFLSVLKVELQIFSSAAFCYSPWQIWQIICTHIIISIYTAKCMITQRERERKKKRHVGE